MMNPNDFGGQRSKVKVTVYNVYNFVNTPELKPLSIFLIELVTNVAQDERMNPVDFCVACEA